MVSSGRPDSTAETVSCVLLLSPRAPVAVVNPLPLVLIVDDSLTVRRVTQRLLERNGMKVLTARDGVDDRIAGLDGGADGDHLVRVDGLVGLLAEEAAHRLDDGRQGGDDRAGMA